MLDLIKMDIHRLFKTRAFFMGILFSAGISAVTILVIALINMLVPRLSGESAMMLELMVSNLLWKDGVSLFQVIFTGLGSLSLLVSCVISAIFISEEQLSGYVKNIAGQVPNKGMMIVSKFVALAILTLSVMLAYTLGAVIPGVLFFGSSLTLEMMGVFFPAIFVKYLLYLAVATIVLFLCTMTKSKSLAIAIGVIFGTGVTSVVYTVCGMVLQFVLRIDISIQSLVPDGLISTIDLTSEPAALIKGALVAIVYIVVFIALSSIFMKKRDTR